MDRYGNEFVKASTLKNRIRSWPAIRSGDGKGLREFADFLEQCQAASSAAGHLRVLDDQHENSIMLKKLPKPLVDRWRRYVDQRLYEPAEVDKCKVFLRMKLKERQAAVMRHGLCRGCLKRGHIWRSCQKKQNWPEVTEPRWPGRYEDDGLSVSLQGVAADTISHLADLGRTVRRLEIYVFLKFLQKEMSIREEAAARRKRTTSEQPPTAVPGKPTVCMLNGRMCMGVRSQQHCYVQTALVEVAGPRGVRLVRALIDGGADASFIRASLADQLGLEKVGQGTFACVGFKERVEEAHQYDQLYKVVLWNQVEVNPGLRLVETVFGYVLHGQSPGQQTTRQRHAYRCQLVDVERMWTLDAVGVAAEETAERDPPVPTWNATENRYEMGLVWKSDQRPVSNLMLSKTRTHRMTEKLNVEQFQEYDDHLHQLLEDAVIEPALPSPPSEFILPHRGLHRNGKLRVVFDGSAPDGAGMSLNSYLEPGENLLHRLPAVLLNFRSGAVGCQTDIRAAFHQIVLTEEDRQFVQLLWAGQRLRFRRVPFGLTCSPYMLLCTIAEHVRRCLRDEPVLLQKVQDSVYMDDMCPSFSTRAEAEAGLTKMGDVFSEASMDLHKTRMSGDDTEDEKVLGLLWSTRSDRLAVTVPQVTCPGTRTELLSARTERRSGALSPEERREALRFWIRVSQSAAYAPELEALTAGAPLPPNSRLEKVPEVPGTEPSRPFSRVGVDFFGPMYVKGGDKVTTTC
ncbi:hypothetical protein FJT64_019069 [Amphibalanus amphitrite]|uniref:Reverse transcriptase domain-containing protein n=1 Tax=Amphibalanus amphitrite TaxID=1232801 RepID=A0A6A4X178_AMPAM|nr:hypothetical protein FJT64_019069 [Amphibalanus amphitrite]